MVRVLAKLSLLFLLLAGCTSVQGSLNGKLALTVSGLPGGVEANVVVRGSGVEKVLKASGVLELPEGEYTVEAAEVSGPQGEVYAPTVQGSPVKVEYGKTAEVRVDYAVRRDTLPATLTVVIQGLPSGAEGRVTVYGPGGVSWNLTSTTTLRGVKAGTYSVFADSVVAGGRAYTPKVEPSSLTLSGGSASTVVVQYLPPDTGYLAVEITGLPSGAEGDVEVRSGGSLVATLKASQVLEVVVGTYLVVAKDVVFQGTTYRGTVSPSPAEVKKGSTASVRVSYAPVYTTGRLVVTVSGLPSGVNADVVVEGPNGFQRALTRTTTLDGLSPGTYTVTARDVAVTGGVYRATVRGSPVQVEAGATASVEVSYVLVYTTGTLTVTISGLPPGASADVVVEGPNGFRRALTRTTTLDGLSPGIYTVTARDVATSGGVYRAIVQGSPAQVEAGATSGVGVNYQLDPATAPGDLLVEVNGLPSGALGNVRVQGPGGFDRSITQTTLFSSLPAGYYTVSAGDVVYSGRTYRATVSGSPVRVGGGTTATVQVSYSLYSAFLTVQISGLPGPVANVVVTGANGYSRSLNSTAVLIVEPGVYAVSAYPVVVEDQTYIPTVQGSPVSLDPGGNGAIRVVYEVRQ